jgi:hypothetical protein
VCARACVCVRSVCVCVCVRSVCVCVRGTGDNFRKNSRTCNDDSRESAKGHYWLGRNCGVHKIQTGKN